MERVRLSLMVPMRGIGAKDWLQVCTPNPNSNAKVLSISWILRTLCGDLANPTTVASAQ